MKRIPRLLKFTHEAHMPRRHLVYSSEYLDTNDYKTSGTTELLQQDFSEYSEKLDYSDYCRLLQACRSTEHLQLGRKVHAQIAKAGLEHLFYVGNNLISMYSRCGSLFDAYNAFINIHHRNVGSWNVMISTYGHYQQYEAALDLFHEMLLEGVVPNEITLVSVLNSCLTSNELNNVKLIHALSIELNLSSNTNLATAILNMYANCGYSEESKRMFDQIRIKNVVTWNVIIGAYQNWRISFAFFTEMLLEGLTPNNITFINVLSPLNQPEALIKGKSVHDIILESVHAWDVYVNTALIGMYMKCGKVAEARKVFNAMQVKSIVTWNCMIVACDAFGIFRRMLFEGEACDRITFVSVLDACDTLEDGRELHARICETPYESELYCGTALITMYGRCEFPDEAALVFDKMCQKNIITWSAILTAFADCGRGCEAMHYFRTMQQEGIIPNRVTFTSVLNIFTCSSNLEDVKYIHQLIIQQGYERDTVMSNALLNVYGKCQEPEYARNIFDQLEYPNLVSWNSMIGIYVQYEYKEEALQLFRKMQLYGIKADRINFMTILSACTDFKIRKMVHNCIEESGWINYPPMQTSLINIYAKAGELNAAYGILRQMCEHEVTAWNVVIAGYALHGHIYEALKMYKKLNLEGIPMDKVTFVSVLSACTGYTSLSQGKLIHSNIMECGYDSDIVVKNALANMYSKCGSVENARNIFDSMQDRSAISWNGMLQAYTQHGQPEEVLKLIRRMEQEGVKLNEVTFLSVLSSCNHAGLVNEGFQYFHSLKYDRGIEPGIDHYGCMIDLLGRVGKLEEAEKYIKSVPSDPGIITWVSLLGACRVHKDIERGSRAARKVLEIDPENATACVGMSNI